MINLYLYGKILAFGTVIFNFGFVILTLYKILTKKEFGKYYIALGIIAIVFAGLLTFYLIFLAPDLVCLPTNIPEPW